LPGIVLGAIAPVLLTALVGYVWTRSGRAFDGPTLTLLVTDLGMPCLIFANFATSTMPAAAFARSAVAVTAIIFALVGAGWGVLRLAHLAPRIYLPALAFPNVGNLGLPLALYAFGPEGLGVAIVFYTVTSVVNFTLGQAIAAGTMSWRDIRRMPLIYAVILGLAAHALGLALPRGLANILSLLGGITVPLMLLQLGASLGRLKVASLPRAFALSVVRIGMGAAVGFAATAALGITGTARAVMIQDSAMPVAVFSYVFALRWDNRPEEIASLVVVSTLMTILTAPVLLSVLVG
jgi:malate permease and related proteins